jgi:hypothetical protein
VSTKYTTEVVNAWTPLHVLSGVAMAQKGMTVGQALAFSIGFEIFENTAMVKAGWVSPEGSNNMTMDMVMNMFGYYLGKKLPND